jgi:hypothetical protein
VKTHIAKSLVYIKTRPGKVVDRQKAADAAKDYGFGLRTMEVFTGEWDKVGDKTAS